MKEIANIDLSRMNNGAHFQFVKTVGTRVEQEDVIVNNNLAKKAVEAFLAAIKEEDRCLALSQKSLLTDDIATADRERDTLFSGYRAAVKGFLNMPVPDMAKAAKELLQDLKDYRIDPDMQLERETGLITNLVQDCEKKYAAQVTKLGLTPYITALKAANAKVESLLVERTEHKAEQVLGALRKARTATDETYRMVVKTVNALALLSATPDYDAFIDFMNELITRYKQEVLASGKKPAPGPSSAKGQLARLIPAFETAQGLAAGTLSYAGHTAKLLDGTKLYLLYLNGNADNFVWVKIDGDRLAKVDYVAGAGKPGGVK